MADAPFFRGYNRTDCFYAMLLQTACDWSSPQIVRNVSDQFGHLETRVFSRPLQQRPDVTVVKCVSHLFIVSSSTHNIYQWVGNVLGSGQATVPGAVGRVSNYFGSTAESQYDDFITYVLDNESGRKVVIVGWSLGGATATIHKSMLKLRNAIDSACFAISSPRVGNNLFVEEYPTDNFYRFYANHDIVPGMPPPRWTSFGFHSGWIPYGELTDYSHVGDAITLFPPDEMRPGDNIPPTAEVALDFDTGLFQRFHNQSLIAQYLRKGMPKELENGYQGYAKASELPELAYRVFYGPFWSLPSASTSVFIEGDEMLQLSIYIRNKADALGFQEVYYFPASDPVSFLASSSFGTNVGSLTYRAAFLSKSCEIYAVRASLVGGVKTGKLVKFPQPIQGAFNSFMSDIEDSICYYGFNTAHNAKRQYHFRGIGEIWLKSSELSDTGIANLPLINTWFGTLISYGERIYTPVSLGVRDISAMTKETTVAQVHLTLATAINLAGKTQVRVTAARGSPTMNGNWLTAGTGGVDSVDITLSGSEQYSPAPGTLGKANFISASPGDGQARTDYEFNGVSSKKTGRVSFLRRGRRSARLRRR